MGLREIEESFCVEEIERREGVVESTGIIKAGEHPDYTEKVDVNFKTKGQHNNAQIQNHVIQAGIKTFSKQVVKKTSWY
jgi:hypothetical protein